MKFIVYESEEYYEMDEIHQKRFNDWFNTPAAKWVVSRSTSRPRLEFIKYADPRTYSIAVKIVADLPPADVSFYKLKFQ